MARSLGNEGEEREGSNSTGMIDGETLSSIVADAVEIMIQQKEWADRLKEICAEADEAGVASKAEIRELARERFKHRDSPEVLAAKLARMAALRAALGELLNTPLGAAAVSRGAQAEAPAKRGRKPKGVQAIEQAQAHLDSGGDFEDRETQMDADLDRIIGERAGAA